MNHLVFVLYITLSSQRLYNGYLLNDRLFSAKPEVHRQIRRGLDKQTLSRHKSASTSEKKANPAAEKTRALRVKKAQKAKSPFSKAIGCLVDAVTPVIGSLTIPDVQPALTLITSSFQSIYAQIAAFIASVMTQIQNDINNEFAEVTPTVANIITESNTLIKAKIIQEFQLAMSTVAEEVVDITTTENEGKTTFITDESAKLLLEILECLADAESSVDNIVYNGLADTMCDVVNALTEANTNVCTTVTELIADPMNTVPIFPQIVFADPDVISSIITTDTGFISKSIQKLLGEVLVEIEQCVNATSEFLVEGVNQDIFCANNSIVTSVNSAVNSALNAICSFIADITAEDIEKITELVTNGSEILTCLIEAQIQSIAPAVEIIINAESTLLITEITVVVKDNNQSIVDQVDCILSVPTKTIPTATVTTPVVTQNPTVTLVPVSTV